MPEHVIALTEPQAALLAALPSRWDTSQRPAVLAPMATLRQLQAANLLRTSPSQARRLIGTLESYGLVERDASSSPHRYRKKQAGTIGRLRDVEHVRRAS
jgi:DNA-binding MarR family transcriptional regulator